ncbi:MAG: hypothetical protein AUI61_00145 [Thaumarchaeota archaeon 13_1_40CM_2_39_13_2]|nr:MAG: hypothetical protein AUI61_00145 [Thaumarchaeota archaeon 13_1_40CM_2_39_13_2]OLE44290.1 MAG: hypothetical protein AUF73_01565 [Thaumarchaeota archaeon 13_1_20CM_2_39_11]
MAPLVIPVKLLTGNTTPIKYPMTRKTAKRRTVPFVISIVTFLGPSEIFFHLILPANYFT